MDACIFTAPLTKFLNAFSFLDRRIHSRMRLQAQPTFNPTQIPLFELTTITTSRGYLLA